MILFDTFHGQIGQADGGDAASGQAVLLAAEGLAQDNVWSFHHASGALL